MYDDDQQLQYDNRGLGEMTCLDHSPRSIIVCTMDRCDDTITICSGQLPLEQNTKCHNTQFTQIAHCVFKSFLP